MGVLIASFVFIYCLVRLFDQFSVDNNDDEIIFKSSFVRGGNLFFPQKLIFTEKNVTLINNHGFKDYYTTVSKRTIPHNKITGINVVRNFIGCNIEIVGKGFQSIVATSFSGESADKIEEILNVILNKN
jgi:hypothetical protein